MKLSAVCVILATCFLSSEAIFNGQDWLNAPYMVRVMYALTPGGQGGQGGGSIISHRHILTSAFVLTPNFQQLTVFLGGTTRNTQQQVTAAQRILHPSYTASPRTNDIGIIVLNLDLVFNRFIQPIALPNRVIPYENEQGTALGFGGWPGNVNPNNLAAAFLRVLPPARCIARHQGYQIVSQFCAEDARLRSDICSDDISGPFLTLERGVEVLSGISSVHVCQVNQQVPAEPSLFTRVSFYRAWITQMTQI